MSTLERIARDIACPAWHDVPICPGIWMRVGRLDMLNATGEIKRIVQPDACKKANWYGPIPERRIEADA